MSMFDTSNISLVLNDPNFLTDMGLTGQAGLLGWLASSLFIAYGVAALTWGFARTHRTHARQRRCDGRGAT